MAIFSSFSWALKRGVGLIKLVFIVICIFYYYFWNYIPKELTDTWPRTQPRDVSTLIQPNHNTFEIVPKGVCDKNSDQPLLLIVVTSAIKNGKARQAIRDTLSKDAAQYNGQIKVIFLLGMISNSDHEQNRISEGDVGIEAIQFGDVLQASFIDSYYRLTIKSLSMLKFFSNHCRSRVKYLMKVDDDIYINVKEVLKLISVNTELNLLTGDLISKAAPMTSGKWYAPPYMLSPYIKGSTYPDYLSGTAYLMSHTTAEILYRTSMLTPAFHLEDVYITGILPEAYNQKLLGENREWLDAIVVSQNEKDNTEMIQIIPKKDNRFQRAKVDPDSCLYSKLISSHGFEPRELIHVHAVAKSCIKINGSKVP